ncbi:hypothetical protein [Pseudonocardia nigra]|uniref:hypothetical protein n=1 Tax=Pseudonocardia nigra TaxID=1921578 RepID=UPI001C602FD3|nr:hypothetical protein [Pseudonocardia nigra]
MTEHRWCWTLSLLGGGYLVLAGWAAAHPPTFTTVLANFGPANDHLVRDFAACAATFGLGLVVAGRRPHWRTPALTLSALWNGLHALSHIHDVADAEPAIVGPVEAAVLVAVTGLFAWLTRLSLTDAASKETR